MKAINIFVFVSATCFTVNSVKAQNTTTAASERAIYFADSLLKSFRYNNFDQYTNLSYPGVVKYYGGNKNFREYVQRTRAMSNSESAENIKLLQILNNINEWQCVVQKTSQATIDGRKAKIITYLVGQS